MFRRFTVFLGLMAMVAANAVAGVHVESEAVTTLSNNSVGTSEFLSAGLFTLPLPASVFGGVGPTATVLGHGGGADVDFYSFFAAGGTLNIDVDNDPFSFDTVVAVFDGGGTLLAFNDDSFSDAGSASGLDSYLGSLLLPGAGTYYVAISQFANFPSAAFTAGGFSDLTRPDSLWGGEAVSGATPGDSSYGISGMDEGSHYTMHISLSAPGTPVVPEPASCLIFAGLAAIPAYRFANKRLRAKA